MQTNHDNTQDARRYAKAVEVSKRVRFDIDRDVIRGRQFDFNKKFLPDGLSRINALSFLLPAEKRFLSQVQGRSYANIFGLVERFISAQILDVSKDHWFGDQVALEALVRFTDEEIKHQEMFRRLERMAAAGMPEGYTFLPDPNEVARAVLSASKWAVLGLICHIEIFVLQHYHSSIDPDENLSDLWKDVFLHHAREESQHAILDELEWARENARITVEERDKAVDDLIGLVAAVDGILQAQARADAEYFVAVNSRSFTAEQVAQIHATVLRAYRWQYIVSGVQGERFQAALGPMITEAQMQRIGAALAPIIDDVNVVLH
ncbi:MAG TPA: hypothetical protein PKZ27_11985 [Rhodocyclaceae bacterium]|jgi:hypothetical protein|nr:hypothetical protein [Rhodocyclaceae bacterium]